MPVFIVHGSRDSVIPLDMARRVFHEANEPKTMTVVPRAGHNDLFEQGAWARVSDFLAGLETEAVPAEVQSEARAGPSGGGSSRRRRALQARLPIDISACA